MTVCVLHSASPAFLMSKKAIPPVSEVSKYLACSLLAHISDMLHIFYASRKLDLLTSGWRQDNVWMWGDGTLMTTTSWWASSPQAHPASETARVILSLNTAPVMLSTVGGPYYFICEKQPGMLAIATVNTNNLVMF